MFKTVSKPLAHLIFLSGVNCYDIGSREGCVLLKIFLSCNRRFYLEETLLSFSHRLNPFLAPSPKTLDT